MNVEYTHWNLRILRHQQPDGVVYHALHEVYYDGSGPKSFTKEPATVLSENLEDVRDYLAKALDACNKPVLDYDSF